MARPTRLLLLPMILLILGTVAWAPFSGTLESFQEPPVRWVASPSDSSMFLDRTPPWERGWEEDFLFEPRIRLSDDDGRVWEIVLNTNAVEAIFVAPATPGKRELMARVNRLVADTAIAEVWETDLLELIRHGQVPVRGFVPFDDEEITKEEWLLNRDSLSLMVYPPYTTADTFSVGRSHTTTEYFWPTDPEGSREEVEGEWVDYVIRIAREMYVVEGHNPGGDECIKLRNSTLVCDEEEEN